MSFFLIKIIPKTAIPKIINVSAGIIVSEVLTLFIVVVVGVLVLYTQSIYCLSTFTIGLTTNSLAPAPVEI